MENQRLCNEAMAKLMEAQDCQYKIVDCDNQLQQIQASIAYGWQSYLRLSERYNGVARLRCDWIGKLCDKLNDALAKALDAIYNEMDMRKFNINSLGSCTIGAIFGFMALHGICIPYSAEVSGKLAKVAAKGWLNSRSA